MDAGKRRFICFVVGIVMFIGGLIGVVATPQRVVNHTLHVGTDYTLTTDPPKVIFNSTEVKLDYATNIRYSDGNLTYDMREPIEALMPVVLTFAGVALTGIIPILASLFRTHMYFGLEE